MQQTVDPDLPPSACFSFSTCYPLPVMVLSSVLEARQSYVETSQSWVRRAWSGHCDVALFSERLTQWDIAFQKLLKTQILTDFDRRAAAVLEIDRRQFEVSLMLASIPRDKQPEQVWWDDKLQYFKETVEHAATAVVCLEKENIVSPSFSLDSGINVHLYKVAGRCRDPVIRRRAIALLRSAQRQEELWIGNLVAQVAERIVELEEDSQENIQSCHDIPEEARVQSIAVRFDPSSSKAEISFFVKGNVVNETLIWQSGDHFSSNICWLRKSQHVSAYDTGAAKSMEATSNKSSCSERRWHNRVVVYGAGSMV